MLITVLLRLALEKLTKISTHPFSLLYHHRNVEPVHVYVCRGKEDVAVKVVDEGGGIKRSSFPLVWSYFYSTCSTIEGGKDESREKSPPLRNRFGKTLQGSGMGLPLARLYSCYFGEPLLFPLLLLLLFPVPTRFLSINTSFPVPCCLRINRWRSYSQIYGGGWDYRLLSLACDSRELLRANRTNNRYPFIVNRTLCKVCSCVCTYVN